MAVTLYHLFLHNTDDDGSRSRDTGEEDDVWLPIDQQERETLAQALYVRKEVCAGCLCGHESCSCPCIRRICQTKWVRGFSKSSQRPRVSHNAAYSF